MHLTDICLEDIYRELKRNRKYPDEELIKSAYDYASKMHRNSKKRLTGEAFIYHPLRTAYLIASWGLNSDSVCSALLHDVVKDTPATFNDLMQKFNSDIVDMIASVTALDKDIQYKTDISPEEFEELSGRNLSERINEKAVYIKAADRADNLSTSYVLEKNTQVIVAQNTREILIPMLLREKAYRIVDILEDLCLQIEHPFEYEQIKSAYTRLRLGNSYTTDRTIKLFSDVFSPNHSEIITDNSTALDCIADFKYRPSSLISVYRQLVAKSGSHSRDNLLKNLNKKNIVLYDLTLIIKDDYCYENGHGEDEMVRKPKEIFFSMYSGFIADKNITLSDFGHTTYKDSKYYILKDEMDNLYRLFVKSEKEHRQYKLGVLADDDKEIGFIDKITDVEKIKVYKRDHSSLYVENGSTFLDVAFAIQGRKALHFDYALIEGDNTHHLPDDPVHEGDIIIIKTNSGISPTLHWFKFVKTENSINHLIRYFEKGE